MRVLALVLAGLLLAMPLAVAQTNNTTAEQNDTDDGAPTNETDGTDDTEMAGQGDDGEGAGNVTLPDRTGHVPWAGLAVGFIIFAAAVVVSRVTYHGRD